MAAVTPRRSSRNPHQHTPKMTERKKGLFQSDSEASRESLTKHRQLTVVNSESESDDCDLGIMGALDSSSCDENDPSIPKTPKRTIWHGTRSQSRKLLQENQDLKNFIKSPFTLKEYQTRYSCPGSSSTPATPHLQNHPGTPSSTHSCTSVHTTSSTSSRARKSLASLIADTESCSSSLKDLNFDTDSGTDSKENTPSKPIRRSTRRHKMTPKFQSFKGVLVEQKKNISPFKTAVVCLTKIDMTSVLSPTQMLKTPHNTSEAVSPPKISHNRRSAIQVDESPDSACDSEKSHKRLHYDNMTDNGPSSKHARLENTVPKARTSLFNSDRLKEILSAKSFYGKSNPDLNTNVTAKISHAIEATNSHCRRLFTQSNSHRRKRRPGQINLGVRHRIRKPKPPKHKTNTYTNKPNTSVNKSADVSILNKTASSVNDTSMLSQNSSQELGNDRVDPFDKEKQTIEALLSQWTEEEIPESELRPRPEVPCFNSTIIEETRQIFQPVTAVPVSGQLPQDSEAVFVELGAQSVELTQNVAELPQNVAAAADVVMSDAGHSADHGEVPESGEGQFLPVEGGYILVNENVIPALPGQEDLPDLDEIERELKMLDQQILKMAHSNNMNAEAVLASTETALPVDTDKCVTSSLVHKLKGDESRLVFINYRDRVHSSLTDYRSNIVKLLHTVEAALYVEGCSKRQNRDSSMQRRQSLSSGDTYQVWPNGSSPAPVPETDAGKDKPKLFPIFSKPNPGTPTTPTSKGVAERGKKSLLKDGSNQYVIDAGQNKFGATQCTECSVIYQIGDPQDEHDHLVHHNATDVLKFNGLKEEYIVGRSDTARCIRIRGGEPGWKKVETLLERVVHPHLGYGASLPRDTIHAYTAYLYVDKKQIVGCLIVEPKVKAYKLISGDPDCCSVEQYPVKCGVSRVWTHINYRRRGLASRMLDCARASFLYGAALTPLDVAFSAPTMTGKAFATSYCGTEHFYVYLD